jgi:hypothetical protein
MLLWLTGCSAQYHLNRYQTKGGTCGKIDTIKIQKYDTILNKYYYHDSLVIVNDRVVPLTRQEIRYMYKIHHDTLKHKETIVKEKIRYEKAKDKNERKMKTSPWILGVVILGLVALILILLRFR